jgi:protease YdgD
MYIPVIEIGLRALHRAAEYKARLVTVSRHGDVMSLSLSIIHRAAIIASLSLIFVISAAQAQAIDRQSIWDDVSRSVGRCDIALHLGQENESNGSCTCFLIAPDVILTAAHCLHEDYATRTPDSPKVPMGIAFQLGANGGERISRSVVSGVVARGKGEIGDWVSLRLRQPAEGGNPLPIAIGPIEDGAHTAVVHYARRPDQRPSGAYLAQVERECRIDPTYTAAFIHDCLLGYGASGSPLLVYNKATARWTIVGINIGVRPDKPAAKLTSTSQRSSSAFTLAIPISAEMLLGIR